MTPNAQAAAFKKASGDLYHNLVTVVSGLATMNEKDSWAWIVDQNWPTHFEDYLKTLVERKRAHNLTGLQWRTEGTLPKGLA